jgi:hypothetical protein
MMAIASACLPNPCVNATCTQNTFPFPTIPTTKYDFFPNGLPYTCNCPSGREGTRCERATTITLPEVYVSNCTMNPCKNMGTCVLGAPGSGSKACACPCGYTGKYCEYKATDGSMSNGGLGKRQDFCSPNPCQNGGTCVTLGDGHDFLCLCPPGWKNAPTSPTSSSADWNEKEGFCTEAYLFNGASTIGAGLLVTVVSLVAGLLARL